MNDPTYRPVPADSDPLPFGVEAEPLYLYAVKTFGWMFLGLMITFVTAVAFAASGGIYMLISMGVVPVLILFAAELIMVGVLSGRLDSLSINAARGLFFAYAVLNGLTFSSVLVLYDLQTMLLAFLLASLYFGAMAAYGWLTKRDITRFRAVFGIGLLVVIVFCVISMFLPLGRFGTVLCFFGLALFMGLTAYDMQMLKRWHAESTYDYELSKKSSILVALNLYLDFLNIFLYILRLLSRGSRSGD